MKFWNFCIAQKFDDIFNAMQIEYEKKPAFFRIKKFIEFVR
jgi:hypothetical protein